MEALLLEFRASSGAAGAATSTKPWEVEWTELRLKVHYIQSDQSAELPGISLTFDDKVFQTAAAKLPSLQRHLQALERRNVPPEMSMPQVSREGEGAAFPTAGTIALVAPLVLQHSHTYMHLLMMNTPPSGTTPFSLIPPLAFVLFAGWDA